MSIKKNNKGFSLVEMLVAVAILSIVMLAIGWILSAMSKSFGNSQKEIQLQDSVQTTYSVVSNLMKEAQSVNKGITDKYGSVVVDGDRVYIFEETVDQAQSDKESKVPTTSATFYIVEFDRTKNKLYLYDQTYNPMDMLTASVSGGTTVYSYDASKFDDIIKSVSSTTIRQPKYLLSNNVKDFQVVEKLDAGYVIVSLELEYGSREASITQNVYLRNSNVSVEDTEEPDPTGTVTATPTPTIGSGSGLSLINKGTIAVPDTTQISQHSDITVCYESGYDLITEEQEVEVETGYMACPNCGAEMTVLQEQTWNNPVTVLYGCSAGCGYNGWSSTPIIKGLESSSPYWVATGTETQTQTVVLSSTNSGTLEIKNTSLSNDYTNIEVIVYFQDSDAFFAPVSGSEMLTINAAASTGTQACAYYYTATDTNGRCKYLKITIPKLEKAETVSSGGTDTVQYDSYVFNYSWYDASGNKPVVCSYTINGN